MCVVVRLGGGEGGDVFSEMGEEEEETLTSSEESFTIHLGTLSTSL